MTDEIQKCTEIFTTTGNYYELGAYTALFATTIVFSFMRKSIPGVIKSLLDAAVNAFKKK